MKIIRFNDLYGSYLQNFYFPWVKKIPPSEWTYKALNDKLLFDAMGWHGSWSRAVNKTSKGQSVEFATNAIPVMLQWGVEYGTNLVADKAKTAKEQWLNSSNPFASDVQLLRNIQSEILKKYRPEILFYDANDDAFLSNVKRDHTFIQLILGISGSYISSQETLRQADIVFSCAPETVETLTGLAIKCFHVNHAFDSEIGLEVARDIPGKTKDLIFIGQLAAGKQFHDHRINMLEALSHELQVEIFSPFGADLMQSFWKIFIKRSIARSMKQFEPALKEDGMFLRSKFGKRLLRIQSSVPLISNHLSSTLRLPVFGRDMLRIIGESQMTLNIHADSSPRYASNMRLFEVTGMGSCLITDDRPNMDTLFLRDKECVTYTNLSDCLEKIRYFSSRQSALQEIADHGQCACLAKHSYEVRIHEYLSAIERAL